MFCMEPSSANYACGFALGQRPALLCYENLMTPSYETLEKHSPQAQLS